MQAADKPWLSSPTWSRFFLMIALGKALCPGLLVFRFAICRVRVIASHATTGDCWGG